MAVVARDVDFSYRVDVSRGVTLAEPIPALKGITLSIPRGALGFVDESRNDAAGNTSAYDVTSNTSNKQI